MKNTWILVAVLATAGLMGCNRTNKLEGPVVEHIGVEDFVKGIRNGEKDVQLVDVRTPSETNLGMIMGAIEINYFEDDFQQQLEARLDKDRPVYIYCRSGNRSGKAAALMEEMGFKKVYNLEGGYIAWTKQGAY